MRLSRMGFKAVLGVLVGVDDALVSKETFLGLSKEIYLGFQAMVGVLGGVDDVGKLCLVFLLFLLVHEHELLYLVHLHGLLTRVCGVLIIS
jgi:hypothetical protein